MSLLTYDQVRPWAKSIQEKVSLEQMPPWHSDTPRGVFSNDRRLSADEKETLIRWASNGAPKGNAKDMPPMPNFPEGWEIGTPDVVFPIAKTYEVPASGTIPYQFFTVPTNFTEDKWVQAIEIRPGERSVVHHVLVFCREPNAPGKPPAFVPVVPKPLTPAAPPAQSNNPDAAPQGGGTTGRGALIATTAPGTNAMTFAPGTAVRIGAGSILSFQIHYTANGKPSSDVTSVGFVFAKQKPALEVKNSAFTNGLLKLPAGAPDTAVDSAIEFRQDSHITALFPHTHLRGKSWEYRMVYPDGHTETVLSVPRYDFNWQTYYVFTKPLAAPKGARLEATAHYDNSPGNKWNPDPKIEVRWGAQTWEEMQYSGITFTVDETVKQ